jgi:DNA (cytosine-5)-methyltransferase 1
LPCAYYNEIDPYAAQWLRNLIAAGHIMRGEVDERSIVDVRGSDLAGFTQCHFFAGIGIWSRALRRAGWYDIRPAWTGSCPCQPFSVAGKQAGLADPRHLWPEFRRLIEECDPPVVFGEQVAAATDWLRIVRSDLEALGYAVGGIPLEAASAGADHFRDRYWFVADRDFELPGTEWLQPGGKLSRPSGDSEDRAGAMAHSDISGSQGRISPLLPKRASEWPAWARGASHPLSPMVNHPGDGWGEGWTEHEFRSRGFTAAVASIDGEQFVECPDGKWRRLPPPGVRWLGNGIVARVDKLRAIGNAIDARPAAEFIRAYQESAR